MGIGMEIDNNHGASSGGLRSSAVPECEYKVELDYSSTAGPGARSHGRGREHGPRRKSKSEKENISPGTIEYGRE